MVSKKILRMGAQKTPMQKTHDINVGQDTLDIDFLGANRQFNWFVFFLVYDISNKQDIVYDSYNVKMASKKSNLSSL